MDQASNLQTRIASYTAKGYQVISQTPTTAQLQLIPKRGCLQWLIFGPFIFLRKTKQVYITVDSNGVVNETESKR